MRFIVFLFVFLWAGAACAQDQLEISAEKSLEWHEDTQLYIARDGARATRGPLTLEADLLTARRRAKTEDSKAGAIDLVTAEGNVRIFDDKQRLVGDHATYNLDTGLVRVTGKSLRYESSDGMVTAKDSFDYEVNAQKAFAKGAVLAVYQGHKVRADQISLVFAQNKAGKREISTLEAQGNVDILTKDGVLARGDMAVYVAKTDMATLSGQVRITRGETQLEGDRAVLKLADGESQLLNEGSGRVRALLPSPDSMRKGG